MDVDYGDLRRRFLELADDPKAKDLQADCYGTWSLTNAEPSIRHWYELLATKAVWGLPLIHREPDPVTAWLEYVRKVCPDSCRQNSVFVDDDELLYVTMDDPARCSARAIEQLEIENAEVGDKPATNLEGVKKDLVDAVREIGLDHKRRQADIFAQLESTGRECSEGYGKTCLAELVRSGKLIKGEGGYRLPEW